MGQLAHVQMIAETDLETVWLMCDTVQPVPGYRVIIALLDRPEGETGICRNSLLIASNSECLVFVFFWRI